MPRSLQHMSVDEYVVTCDVRQFCRDIADASHVGGQIVDPIDMIGSLQGIVPEAEIEKLKIIGRRGFKLRLLDVDAAHPIALCL